MTSKDFLRLVLIVAAGHENYKLPCACRVLNNRRGCNQFAAAANFADKALDDDNHFEIGSFYTKAGYGAVEVDLFCCYESNKVKF